MASQSENEDLDIVLRNLLPELKKFLDLDEIKLYLLSEDVITPHDLPRIKITDQNSKNSAIVNLYEIVMTREMLHSFVSAIRRSSEDHPGHKQLLEKIERRRRTSVTVTPTQATAETENPSTPSLVSFNQMSNGVDEPPPQNALLLSPLHGADDSVEIDHAMDTGDSESDRQQHSAIHEIEAVECVDEESPGTFVEPLTQDTNNEREMNPPSISDHQRQKLLRMKSRRVNFYWGIFSCGTFVIFLVLSALALTDISYGIRAFSGLEPCELASFEQLFGSYIFISGSTVLAVIIAISLILLKRVCDRYDYCTERIRRILLCFGVFAAVFCVCVVFLLLSLSVYVGIIVYPNVNLFESSTCSRALFFSTYISLILLHIVVVGSFVIGVFHI